MILHIPHSSIKMIDSVSVPNLQENIEFLTDWYADELFQHSVSTRVVFDYSRLVVDVERLVDDPMIDIGKGRLYTTDINGDPIIRNLDVCENLYNNYHMWFNTSVRGYLSYFPLVTVVDCHTFNNEPLPWDGGLIRPDICIGINNTHIPDGLVDILGEYFKSKGLITLINTPYSGSIIPRDFVKSSDVYSVMIEVNKGLYLNDKYERNDSFKDIQYIITGALELINDWESKEEDKFWKSLQKVSHK